MSKELQIKLENLLLKNGQEGKVSNLEPLTGGASAETWKFSFSTKKGSKNLILRKGSGKKSPLAVLKSEEAVIQQKVRESGAPVAEIVAISKDEADLGDAYLMKLVPGESIARKILRDQKFKSAREKLAFQCGKALATIHSVPIEDFKQVPKKSIREELNRLYTTYKSFEQPLPVFEYAFKWLGDKDFSSRKDSLVHGDFRLGNLIVDEKGLAAVIDWEMVSIGNPLLDIGWMCVNSWRFGLSEKVVGGFGDLEELLAGYGSVSKEEISVEEVKIWQVLGSLRWGVICLIQAYSHLQGEVNSVEKAAIGRRVSETEIDIVDLLFLGGK
mgnify:FL=1